MFKYIKYLTAYYKECFSIWKTNLLNKIPVSVTFTASYFRAASDPFVLPKRILLSEFLERKRWIDAAKHAKLHTKHNFSSSLRGYYQRNKINKTAHKAPRKGQI